MRPTERNDRINLVGVASDNVGVTQLEVNHQQRIRKSVTQYNRRPALRFEYPISLKDTTTIEIYAADAAGNSDVVTLTLNVELSNIPEASEASTSEMSEMSEGDDIVLIPAGEFQMGSSRGDSDEKPIHTVYLDAFYIDRHEVTNAQYRKFVEATGHREPLFWGDSRFNEPQQPVVGVSWEDAIAYAKWAGRRLPTEAEWERAAKGGKTGQRFPWGNRPLSPSLVNMGGRVDGYRDTAPVGSFPANPYGLYDMGGNVCEWVADVYPRANASKNGHRVIRGGSWRETFDGTFRSTARRTVPRDKMTTDIGFRCAIDAFPSGR